MKRVTFLHCADLHLDSPMVGLKYLPKEIFDRIQESTFQALRNLIDMAINNKVDFMIIAGDIFDGEDRSLRAQARFRKEMERLLKAGIPVYLIHGNHDHLGGTWTKMEWPVNVHVFADEVEVLQFAKQDGTSVNLYGFSYPERHVTERWIDKYHKEGSADFHIGILHGHFEGASDHGKYAPFRLTDLLEKQFDYWALGHIHKREILATEPPVVYPGNSQGRSRKEKGVKGCYIVSLTESGAEFHFHETNDIQWLEKTLDGAAITTINSLYDLCKREIDRARMEGRGVILSLEVSGIFSMQNEIAAKVASGEFIEILQDQEKDEKDFVWIRELAISETIQLDRSQLVAQGEFFSELFTTIDEFDGWERTLLPLYGHHTARRHLRELSEEEKATIISKAEKKLLQLLGQVR